MTTGTPSATLARWELVGIGFLALASAVYAVFVLIGAVPQIVGALGGGDLRVSLAAESIVPAGAATGTATLVQGTFDTATVLVADISFTARALFAGSVAVMAVMHVAMSLAFGLLCLGLVRGRPFARSVTSLLIAASGILIIGGVLGQGLLMFAQFFIADLLTADPLDGVFPLSATLDFAPIAIGVVIGAIASAFQIGERMQRDTDGLV